MKYTLYILTITVGLITSYFIWVYLQRASFDYNSEGRFFSPENGIVYLEQTKEIYGLLALLGLILTVIFMIRVIKGKTQLINKT